MILQGLGKILFVFIMADQDDPQWKWERLFQSRSANTTFSKATLNLTLARTQHTYQAMNEHVARRKPLSAQLVSMSAPIDEGLLVAMFIESFGDWSNSPFGTTLSALLSRSNHTRQMITSQLLQEFKSQRSTNQMGQTSLDEMLATQQNKNKLKS